jgi:hypothetical protein
MYCDGNDVVECLQNGSGWLKTFSCERDAYAKSVCLEIRQDLAGCSCEDDWHCPEYTACEAGVCVGSGLPYSCFLQPKSFKEVLPTLEIEWGGRDRNRPNAVGSPFPASSQTVMAPLVLNLDDDNEDGKIDERDFPEIVFATFCSSQFESNGVLRALHGGGPDKGKDYFAVCGDKVWHPGDPVDMAYSCEEADLNPTASLAAGDLDGDGIPEIVAMLEGDNGGIGIYSNTGELIYKSPDLGMGYKNPGIALANIDNQGLVELVIGRHVFTLEHNSRGQLQILDTFRGALASGTQGSSGPLSCVADLTGDSRKEIIAATTVYALPRPPAGVTKQKKCKGPYKSAEHTAFCDGKLLVVWDGLTRNPGIVREGFCAIADVLGADQEAPPGPDNPLDGVAEVVTISDGHLQILSGQDGTLRRDISVESAEGGGAPNVDDFDGDGFPEIGSAFQSIYAVMDLQAPTAKCPRWPNPFWDLIPGMQGNPRRDAPCLHNGWLRHIDDGSSKVTGSSVFDFNGDGAAEVVYNDECYFRIYDGASGRILFKEHSPSRTVIEYPVVADVDNDGNAEIVFGTSNESTYCFLGNNSNNGLEVWGDARDLWVPARRIWNQHSYHITNTLESGDIPIVEPTSWSSYNGRVYNSYRSNPRSFGVAPDLSITGLQISSPDTPCGQLSNLLRITARVENKGDLRVGPGVLVSFYGQWQKPLLDEALAADGGGTPLRSVISASLEPGDSILVTAQYNAAFNRPRSIPGTVRAVIDETNGERECREDNNQAEVKVEPGSKRPDLTAEILEVDFEKCPFPRVKASVTNVGSAPATDILLRYYAGDPSQGGTSVLEKRLGGPIQGNGGSQTFFAAMPNVFEQTAVRIFVVVDPLDTVTECNDGNNLAKADEKAACPRIAQ